MMISLHNAPQFGFSGPLIQKTLSDDGLSIPCFEAANLEDAVNCARSVARYGLCLLQ